MRNLNYFALMSAALLTGAVAFTSCSSDDEVAADGGAGATGEVVKTQFAISVPGALSTRLAPTIVQAENNFRGMQNIRLVPITVASVPTSDSKPILGTETITENPIALTMADNGLTTAGDDKYKIYNDVEIPVGTNAFLFYAEATKESGATDTKNGVLVPSYETSGWKEETVSNIKFNLKSILDAKSVTSPRDQVIGALNSIAGTTGWSATTDSYLEGLYTNFIALKAGSSNSVRLAVQDLYNAINAKNVTISDNTVKEALETSITSKFSVTSTGAPNFTLAWTSDPKYPTQFGLPDGAVQVVWSTDKFTEVESNIEYGDGTNMSLDVPALADYVYPAALYYWVNSSIRTANTTVLTTGAAGKTSWNEILDLYTTPGYAVTSETQSVSLSQVINYAVAQLQVNAHFNGEIEDNGDAWPAGAPVGQKIVTVPSEGFTLTGILIGGQKNAEWDFSVDATAGEKTIYDSQIGTDGTGIGVLNSTTGITSAYSLALETAGNSGDTKESVNFALEFVNNSESEFIGKDGVIPVGGKFYLVGKLTADDTHTKVFEQDHTTVANVTINSLKSAYNCIPDLRAPRLELGLAVDLKWQQGLVSNVTIE